MATHFGQQRMISEENLMGCSVEHQIGFDKKYTCSWDGCGMRLRAYTIGKQFTRKTDITRHYRIHLNDRPFKVKHLRALTNSAGGPNVKRLLCRDRLSRFIIGTPILAYPIALTQEKSQMYLKV